MGDTLTKDEIIKAWECCGKNEREKTAKYCDECPAHNKPYPEDIQGCLDYLTRCSISCFKPIEENTVQDTISCMLNKFGEDSQIDVCIEEMSELIKELIKYKRSKIHFREKQAASREHVVEEIGDVMFMIEYLKRIFTISNEDIAAIVAQKAMRTKERYIYE